MADDLELPNLARFTVNSSTSLATRPRKRARYETPVASSDPPLFSSDDDPSLDKYTRGRQKQQYRGPWFEQEPASDVPTSEFALNLNSERDGPRRGKRVFERQYDSGVFLGSDCTDADESVNGLEVPSVPQAFSLPRSSQSSAPTADELAGKQIEHCIEHGIATIDLSSQNINNLSNDTFRPLGAFTPILPRFDGTFFPIESKLQIFLTSNELSSLPEELFNLKDLTVLSLRGNNFYELPPAIGRLRSLVELNVSQNSLQYLPYEILDLFSKPSSLERFQIHPNPFHAPYFPPEQTEEGQEEEPVYKDGFIECDRLVSSSHNKDYRHSNQRSWDPNWEISYRGRSEVRFLDINGSRFTGRELSNSALYGRIILHGSIPVVNSDDIPVPPKGRVPSRVPSLLEVALNACSKSPELHSLPSLLPEHHPEHLSSLLAKAARMKECGGNKCTICDRSFIVARTEWIEWWEIARAPELLLSGSFRSGGSIMADEVSAASPLRQMERRVRQRQNDRDEFEKMVPLMRRGCSWRCVPEKMIVEEDARAVESSE